MGSAIGRLQPNILALGLQKMPNNITSMSMLKALTGHYLCVLSDPTAAENPIGSISAVRAKLDDREFTTSAHDFHTRKRNRIAAMRQAALELANAVSKPTTVLTSAPTNHEIQGYMTGRVDFETEVENEAEDAVKDMEFGLIFAHGGGDQPEAGPPPASEPTPGEKKDAEGDGDSSDTLIEGTLPDPIETDDSTSLKLSMLDIYYEKLDRRQEAKAFVFDRGMLDFKKVGRRLLPCIQYEVHI